MRHVLKVGTTACVHSGKCGYREMWQRVLGCVLTRHTQQEDAKICLALFNVSDAAFFPEVVCSQRSHPSHLRRTLSCCTSVQCITHTRLNELFSCRIIFSCSIAVCYSHSLARSLLAQQTPNDDFNYITNTIVLYTLPHYHRQPPLSLMYRYNIYITAVSCRMHSIYSTEISNGT